MEKANIKETLNGKNDDKYITPYTLDRKVNSIKVEEKGTIELTEGTNLNDIVEPGLYTSKNYDITQTLINSPYTSIFSLQVLRTTDTGVVQVATYYNSDDHSVRGIKIRGYEGSWGSWNSVPFIYSNGVIEIGKYIDFHEIGSTNDLDARLYLNNGELKLQSIGKHGDDYMLTSNTLTWFGKLESAFLIKEGDNFYYIPFSNNIYKQTMTPTYIEVLAAGYNAKGVTTFDSDKRLKMNIKDSEDDALSVLDKIKIKSFDWKDKTRGSVDFGLIADDLQEINSSFVFEVGEKKIKNIDSTKLIPFMLKCLQEQKEEIEKLKEKLTVKGY